MVNLRSFVRIAAALISFTFALGGCGGYPITGKAIAGEFGTAMFVPQDDASFQQRGVPNAEIAIYRDPTKPNRERVASGRTGPGGEFDLTLTNFGAGWMVEQWLIQVVKPGYETVESLITFPSKKDRKHLLIIMPQGVSIAPSSEDSLWDQADRYR